MNGSLRGSALEGSQVYLGTLSHTGQKNLLKHKTSGFRCQREKRNSCLNTIYTEFMKENNIYQP